MKPSPRLYIVNRFVSVVPLGDLGFLTLGQTPNTPPPPNPWLFFLDDKTSAADVFRSCLFIPPAHFETSLEMVSYYGYDIWRLKWSSHFWVKMHVLSTFFNNKRKTCQWNDVKGLFKCYFTREGQRIIIYRDFNLISNSWWDSRWRPLLVTSQASSSATTH